MIVQKSTAVYFSPTGTTTSVIKHMLARLGAPREEIDLTPYINRDESYSFSADELVIIGIPVYGGHIPSAAEKRIKLLQGDNTPVVLVATYGSIHYSNVLFELQQIVAANGFITVAAAAVVAEHNAVSKIASGRPNAQDLSAISTFTSQVYAKLLQSDSLENIAIKSKKLVPLRPRYPVVPYGDKKCINCGVCVKQCPVQAIDNPRKKAEQVCIRCIRCIKYCPQNARTYMKLMKAVVWLLLSAISCGKEKQPEFFL
jgi:ferredoxin/flavodoxin